MKRPKSFAQVFVLAIIGICLSGILFVVLEQSIYQMWVSLVAPKPQTFKIDPSRRSVLQISPNLEGIDWLGTTWTDDGKYVGINDSRGQVYAKNLMLIDPKNAVYTQKIETLATGNILGLVNKLPFTLEKREALWAGCQNKNIFLTAKYVENQPGFWELRLWEGDQLMKTFEPMNFPLGLYQSGLNNDPVGWTIEHSHFSDDCRYGVINFSHDIWLLDTVEPSFSRIFTARKFIGTNLHDIVEGSYEFVWPSWSPNNHEFVFGDYQYGVEKYDVETKKQSWVSPPGTLSGVIEWSKTGNWFLGSYGWGMGVVSSDGSKIAELAGCENIEHPSWSAKDTEIYTENASWSPTEDKFAFICKQYDQSTCTDGKCENEAGFLVIWDLSNLDGN